MMIMMVVRPQGCRLRRAGTMCGGCCGARVISARRSLPDGPEGEGAA